MKNLVLYTLLLSIFLFKSLFSQYQDDLSCGLITIENPGDVVAGNGMYKPSQTLPPEDPDAFFRCLIVYIEFPDDPVDCNSWPHNSFPTYANQMFAQFKNSSYTEPSVSAYFLKMSGGKYHLIADQYHVMLPHNYSWYQRYGSLSKANWDALEYLDNDIQLEWSRYDNWRWNITTQQHERIRDY
jgi:hypothetical protein